MYVIERYNQLLNLENAFIFVIILLILVVLSLYRKYKNKAMRLVESEEKFNKYTNFTGDSIIIFDETGKIFDINESTIKKLGYHKKEILNMNMFQIDSYFFSISNLDKIINQLKTEKFIYYDTERISKSGQIIPVEIRLCFYKKHNYKKRKKYIMCVAKDISEQKKAHMEIYNLSYYDQLTKLPNRKYIYKFIQSFIGLYNNISCALLILDINNFKGYNDIYGHDFGDKVLVETASRLSKAIDSSSILSRTSADEFMIFKKKFNNNEEDIYKYVSKLIETVRKPFHIEGKSENISVSIGISIINSQDNNINDLFKKADFALYNAKQSGRNKFSFYDEKLSKKLQDRYNLINDMEKAIKDNNFEMYYQPIVDVKTREYVYMEALIRWKHPRKGYIPPDQFIPIAEETKIIVPLGLWVIDNVISQINEWDKQGLNSFKVCINISSIQLADNSFYDDIIRIFERKNVAYDRVIFEITETEYMEVEERIEGVMNKIKKTGIDFSLDDFGTGYASLNYVKKMPISHIKIDKSFINDIENDKFNQLLFNIILYLAKEINIDVIAEGIEKLYQMEYLIDHGCNLAQGYFLQVPLPVNKITEMLIDNK